MRISAVLVVLLILFAGSRSLNAQENRPGPWDSDAERAAEAAAARLGPKRALDIRATVLRIPLLEGRGSR